MSRPGTRLTRADSSDGRNTSMMEVSCDGRYQAAERRRGRCGEGFVLSVSGLFATINYPGSTYTLLAGLNSQNLAVGFYGDTTSQYAFAWQNGTFMLAPLPGATSSRATSVNDNGDVAGWYLDASNTQYGFVWNTTTNKVIKVKGPKNSKYTTVNAINNTHAQITGTYVTTVGPIGFIGTCTGTDCF